MNLRYSERRNQIPKIMYYSLLLLLILTMNGIIMTAHADTLVIAHRGNSSVAPENTMAAVKSALSLDPQPQWIEIDVHRSLDGEIVVSHDEDTQRTTGIPGLIREQNYESLQKLDASYKTAFGDKFKGESLPTLREVLQAVENSSVNIMIEAKQLLVEDDIIELLRSRNEISRHILASFDELTIYRAKQIEPKLKTLYLIDRLTPGNIHRGRDIGADLLGINKGSDPRLLDFAQQQGFQVWVWTVDESQEIEQWHQAGVDGIISNRPALARQIVNTVKGAD